MLCVGVVCLCAFVVFYSGRIEKYEKVRVLLKG